jgi:hypothetical protein
MANDNKWSQPDAPPPPLFLGKKERDFVKQVSDEIIEKMVGQQILYYPVDIERTNFHPLYGEAIEKTYLPPLRIYALVEWQGSNQSSDKYGIDRVANISVHFHKRRLTEDQDLHARIGDFVFYEKQYFEIVELSQPRKLFGQDNKDIEIVATCRKAREGLFDAS